MKILLKILVLPILVILAWFFGTLINGWITRIILGVISGFAFLLALWLWWEFFTNMPDAHRGITILLNIFITLIAFAISPQGIPRFAEWLVEKLEELIENIKDM